MDILDKLAKLEKDFEAANGLLEGASGQIERLKADVAERDGQIADLNGKLGDLEISLANQVADKVAEVEAIKAELAEAKALVSALEASKQSVNQKALELVASQGTAPFAVKVGESGAATTKDEAIEAYVNATNPTEKAKIYAKYKELIFS